MKYDKKKIYTTLQEPQLLGRGLKKHLIKQHFKHAFFNKITSVLCFFYMHLFTVSD